MTRTNSNSTWGFAWTFFFTVFASSAQVVSPSDIDAQVQLGTTVISGANNPARAQQFFGGIPYAEPPVGDLRFSPPKLKLSLDPASTFNALNFGPSCLQPLTPEDTISEDCLTLNIYRPSDVQTGSPLPVMVWIYGGGFVSTYIIPFIWSMGRILIRIDGGSSSYEATDLVEYSIVRGTPIVYVSFNYRLGAIGFPQGNEAASQGSLNLGLQDQWAALQWVQANIGTFGGDPAQVTVFGQSAGSISLSNLYLHPNFSTVARAAIFQSGQASSLPLFHPTARTLSWLTFSRNVPACNTSNATIACLRTANTSELVNGMNAAMDLEQFPFPPTLDSSNGMIPNLTSKRLAQTFPTIPFIAGNVLDEGTIFVPGDISEESQLVNLLVANYTPSPRGNVTLKVGVEILVFLYPDDPAEGSPYGTGNTTLGMGAQFKRAASIVGDLIFQGQRRIWSQTASSRGTKSYAYVFTENQTGSAPYLGVSHGSEIPYVYGTATLANTTTASPFSQTMMDYWISFATSLDPNDGKGSPRPNWEAYSDSQRILDLNSEGPQLVSDDFRSSAINYINKNGDIFSQ
ncbi:Carboxylesterase [Amylostereum chailletii]|nr:Carboxylesterase [Amylostereum chailletii]